MMRKEDMDAEGSAPGEEQGRHRSIAICLSHAYHAGDSHQMSCHAHRSVSIELLPAIV